MRAYDLVSLSQSIVSNDELLSLPFLRKKENGELTLGFFVFDENEGYVIRINQVWELDPILTTVKQLSLPCDYEFPRRYRPIAQCTAKEYEDVFLRYCNSIDSVLEGKDKEEYENLAKKIIPKELTGLYIACGAELLSLEEVE